MIGYDPGLINYLFQMGERSYILYSYRAWGSFLVVFMLLDRNGVGLFLVITKVLSVLHEKVSIQLHFFSCINLKSLYHICSIRFDAQDFFHILFEQYTVKGSISMSSSTCKRKESALRYLYILKF